MSASAPTASNKSEKTRLRILDAAARTFRDKGYSGTTLNDIASAAGMRAGSIYYHFESKEQILEEVFDIGIRRISEAVIRDIEALPESASPASRIRVGVETHLETLLEHEAYASANIRTFGQVEEPVQRRNLRLRRAYADFWRALLKEARDAGEIDESTDLTLLRMFLFGALNWSIEWYRPGKRTPGEFADQICTIIFDGVRPSNHPEV